MFRNIFGTTFFFWFLFFKGGNFWEDLLFRTVWEDFFSRIWEDFLFTGRISFYNPRYVGWTKKNDWTKKTTRFRRTKNDPKPRQKKTTRYFRVAFCVFLGSFYFSRFRIVFCLTTQFCRTKNDLKKKNENFRTKNDPKISGRLFFFQFSGSALFYGPGSFFFVQSFFFSTDICRRWKEKI